MAKLNLDVLVNVKGAEKLSGLSGGLSRTGANLSKFVTLPLLGLGAAFLKAGADSQKADAQLASAFKSMKASAFTSIAALNEHATALAEATQFDDEGIKHAEAVLLTFGNVTGDVFTQGVDLAADMSAALGQDLQSSTIQLGKALNDPIKGLTSLRRVGVAFTEDQQAMITSMVEAGDTAGAQGVIIAELGREFGGTAKAIGSTDAGVAAQAFEDLGEAGESIGTILLPPLATLARFVSSLAQGFQGLDPGMKQFIVILGGIVAAIGPVVFIAGKLIGAFQAVGVAFRVLSALFLTNPFVLLAAAVIAIAALIILNWDKISGFLSKVWDAILVALRNFVKPFVDLFQGLSDAVGNIWDGVVNIIKGAINGIIDVINGLFSFLNGIQIGIPEINLPGGIHIGGGTIDPFNIGLIPHLAEGGIISSPTLALLGESGPEAVVPLGRKGGGDTHFHSHIDVRGEEPFIRDEAGLVRANQRIAFLEGF